MGMTDAEEVVMEHLERLERHHPVLNAAVRVFREEAPLQARYLDAGPLAGVPVSVKETIGIDGETVTAGSARMPQWRVPTDSIVVRRLRDAGAVLLARGNLSEFGMVHEADNLVFGRTNNPLHPERSPGGSSGGDAALVASGSVVCGIGTDIGGSIRYPAHCCGVVGFKPASEAVPKTGTWPPGGQTRFSDSMLAIGPITRSVRDARLVYEILADVDLAARGEMKPPRLILPHRFEMDVREPVVAQARERAERGLAAAELTCERLGVPDAGALFRDYLTVLIHDYVQPIRNGLTTEDGKTLSLVREAARHVVGRPTVHKYLFRLIVLMTLARPSAAVFEQARSRIETARQRIRALLGRDGVLLLPTNGALAMPHGEAAAYMARPGVRTLFTPTIYANVLNLPAVTVPAWTDRDPQTGLVPGVMLCSAPGGEQALFHVAEALEEIINPVVSQQGDAVR
jgi:Asp-tRNA(Asn)/Glu-tRNA(Gln) amidotransferase A subunit family amidase